MPYKDFNLSLDLHDDLLVPFHSKKLQEYSHCLDWTTVSSLIQRSISF